MSTKKRLVVGDIHGHWDNFEKIYWKEDPDEVIILGDYFDSFHGTDESIIECVENILSLRKIHLKEKKGDFIMLIGNHDYHYFSGIEQYSGYRNSYAYYACTKLEECIAKGILQYAYVSEVNKTIYSHAGVTNSWMNTYNIPHPKFINEVRLDAFRFTYKNGGDSYGNSIYSSPLWVRPRCLVADAYEDESGETWTQIVGHTQEVEPVVVKENGRFCYGLDQWKMYAGKDIVFQLDCMPSYYMIETYDFESEKIISRELIHNEINRS